MRLVLWHKNFGANVSGRILCSYNLPSLIHTQGRETSSQYQELTVDMRRLRNLLEDLEEHEAEDTSFDISACQTTTHVLQCKAILRGLDVNLESFRCSAQEQEGVRPETALAVKASVQVITHSLSCMFESLFNPRRTINTETNGMPTASIARQSSASGGSSEGVTTATNVTLRLPNSARIISLAGRHPLTEGGGSE